MNVEITDETAESGDCLYVFTYVGLITCGTRVVKVYPKYLLSINGDPVSEMKQVLRVLEKYSRSDEQIINIFMDLVLLGKCDELWVFGETISSGMQRELDVAKRRKQTIRYFNENFEEVESCLISTHQAN